MRQTQLPSHWPGSVNSIGSMMRYVMRLLRNKRFNLISCLWIFQVAFQLLMQSMQTFTQVSQYTRSGQEILFDLFQKAEQWVVFSLDRLDKYQFHNTAILQEDSDVDGVIGSSVRLNPLYNHHTFKSGSLLNQRNCFWK